MHRQIWGYKAEETIYLGVREQKRLNDTDLNYMQELSRIWRHLKVNTACLVLINYFCLLWDQYEAHAYYPW